MVNYTTGTVLQTYLPPEVYQGCGAVYDRLGKETYMYLELEDKARQQKVGIWSLGKRETGLPSTEESYQVKAV